MCCSSCSRRCPPPPANAVMTASLHAAAGWASSADEEALLHFARAGHKIWVTTLGPKDLVYTPVGFLACHQVLNSAHVLGFRVGAIAHVDLGTMEQLIDSHNKAGRRPTVLTQAMAVAKLLGEIGGRQSSCR